MTTPLIYTTKGNLPSDHLTYSHQWIDNSNETTLVEEWRHGEELVKRNVHTLLRKAVEVFPAAAAF